MRIERIKSLALAAAAAVAASAGTSEAQVLFAKPVATGTGSCNSLINAGTLSACIGVAAAGDNIVALSGTHVVNGVTITVPLTINGDGVGLTILDAQLADRHFVVDPGAGGSVLIKDLTFTNGSATAAGGAFADGGALQVVTGSLELVRTEITNSSAFDGGAVSCDGCTELTVRESRLAGNSATTDGGAIHTDADVTLVANTTIEGNTAGDQGGGIYKVNDSIIIRDSELVGNAATADDGGGLYSSQDDAKILRSAFIANTAVGNGGGVSMHGSQLSDELLVLNSTFSANQAAAGGAVDVGVNNPAFLGNVTMVDNLATVAGQSNDIESSSAAVSINLSNSILTHPAGANGNPECGNAGAPVTLDGVDNLIDTNASCLGAVVAFRIAAFAGALGPLDFHNGPTRSYSLVGNAATNNAIDNPNVTECLNPRSGTALDKDQRLRPRPVGVGAQCDLGSFEQQ
jgi:predicted outer membrane repeat protein